MSSTCNACSLPPSVLGPSGTPKMGACGYFLFKTFAKWYSRTSTFCTDNLDQLHSSPLLLCLNHYLHDEVFYPEYLENEKNRKVVLRKQLVQKQKQIQEDKQRLQLRTKRFGRVLPRK